MIASDNGPFIKLFDASTCTCVKNLRGHIDRVVSLAFFPDSQSLASASYDRKGRVWDITAAGYGDPAEEEEQLELICADVSSDAKVIALGADDFVQLRDIASGICTQTLHLDEEINTIAFSLNSKTLATVTESYVQIRDLSAAGESRYKIEWPRAEYLTFSHDSKLLAAPLWGKYFDFNQPDVTKLLDVTTGKLVQALDDVDNDALAFSHDGKSLAYRSVIWETVTGAKGKLKFAYHDDIRFSKDDRFLLTDEESLDLQSGERAPVSSALTKSIQLVISTLKGNGL